MINKYYESSDITQSENFKNWFGNSKVVDKAGNPLVVYHGTELDFNEFNISRVGTSTDSGMWGQGFYFTDDINYANRYAKNKKLLQCYLSIKNPYYIKNKIDIPKIKVPEDTLDDLKNSDKNYSKIFTKLLKDKGYDGVIISLNGNNEFVVYNSNQIKSINAKEFNSNSNNIYEKYNGASI